MRSDLPDKIRFDAARNRHLLIALSGGADSVALACLLAQKRNDYGIALTAAHYNHHIRGSEADLDAQFCHELCRKLEIPLIEGEGDVPAEAARTGAGLETVAREMRYRFLYKAMDDCGADLLALAHHMDDQAETVLMHLLRGTGPEGISGMNLLRGKLYRPLLGFRKTELTQYLAGEGISWREDATNVLADTPRNALRLNVLPEIEKSYPSAVNAVARYASIARLESEFLNSQTENFCRERVTAIHGGHRLSLEGGFEEVLLRRALRKLCGRDLLQEKTDELVALCRQNRGKAEISKALFAEKTPSAIYILRKGAKITGTVPLNLQGETRLEEICAIFAEPSPVDARRNTMNEEILDAQALEGAWLRTRRDGDRIHPLGGPGERLLSDYLTDKKIDRPLRDELPLLAKDGRVLWVCGVGIAEDVKIRPDTKLAVRLIYKSITDEKAEV